MCRPAPKTEHLPWDRSGASRDLAAPYPRLRVCGLPWPLHGLPVMAIMCRPCRESHPRRGSAAKCTLAWTDEQESVSLPPLPHLQLNGLPSNPQPAVLSLPKLANVQPIRKSVARFALLDAFDRYGSDIEPGTLDPAHRSRLLTMPTARTASCPSLLFTPFGAVPRQIAVIRGKYGPKSPWNQRFLIYRIKELPQCVFTTRSRPTHAPLARNPATPANPRPARAGLRQQKPVPRHSIEFVLLPSRGLPLGRGSQQGK